MKLMRGGARAWSVAVGLIGLSAATMATAQTPKRVYIAPDDHTDYFWTADDVTYRQVFGQMLDYYLDLADSTAGNAPDFQSKWSCDGWYWLHEYQATRTPAQFARLISRIKSGHITSPLNALAVNEGAAPAEAVLRGMYWPGGLERQYDLRFRLAYNMENQTHPMGLFSLWSGAGAMYSWKGICNCATVCPNPADREHDIYWAVGLDGSRVLVKWNSQLNGNESLGGYAEARFPAAAVDFVTTNAPFNGFAARYPYGVIGAFGKGWDDLSTFTNEFVTTAIATSNASRRVIVSNELDFFQDFAGVHGAALPSETRSYGNEWDIAVAALAEQTARLKRALPVMRTAEALAAVVSLDDPTFMNTHAARRDTAQIDMGLYFEHDFAMTNPPTGSAGIAARVAWQRRLASEIESYAQLLLSDALARVAATQPAGTGGETRVVVFNPLSWTRSDVVEMAWAAPGAVRVIDLSTGAEVPSELDSSGGAQVLRFVASGVPSVGTRLYGVRSGAGQVWSPAATVTDELTAGGSTSQTVTIAVDANSRDATSQLAAGETSVRTNGYSAAEPDNFVGSDAELQQAAVQFPISLPSNATVVSANIVVRASGSQSAAPSGALLIRAYDRSDCPAFVNGQKISLDAFAPLLATGVQWPSRPWPGAGVDATSPDVKALVQQFITRPGYAPGQHLGFVITSGTTPANFYVGFNDFARPGGTPARLVVTYSTPGSGGGAPTGRKIIANGAVDATVDPRGAITSLRTLSPSPKQFAGTLGGRAINDLGPSSGTVIVEHAGPVTATLRAVAGGPVAHTTRITLQRESDRVTIHNQITQNFDAVQTWAFPFTLSSPDVRHEEVGAILQARLSTDPSGAGHYSPRNARYDWLTLNHFALMNGQIGGAEASVVLSNMDCAFFKTGNSTITTLDTTTPAFTVLAGGNATEIPVGITDQGGDTLFTQRFALTARNSQIDQAAAMRLALEHQHPLVAAVATGAPTGTVATPRSFLNLTNPDVIAWAFKPAQDGPSAPGGPLTLRLWNVSDTPVTATVQTGPRVIGQALVSTHIETLDPTLGPAPTVNAGGAQVSLTRQQLRTLRLSLASACNPADICGVGATYSIGAVDVLPDGQLTLEDFLVFLSAFSDETGCPGVAPCNPADVCGSGATYTNATVDVPPDGQLSIDDFLVFLSAFADAGGCP